MANTIQFDLVSPERRVASFEATAVQVPGSEGRMTVMAGHAPVISSLRPGLLHVEGGEGGDYVVTGGFAEISESGITVLAERAYDKSSAPREEIQAMIDKAREEAKEAPAEEKDAAELFVSDLVHLLDAMS